MAITKGGKKAHRQSLKKALVNERRTNKMKDTVKVVKTSVLKKEKTNLRDDMSAAFKAIDKAAKRGVIKKGAANRKKSRLSKAVAKIA